MQSQGDNKLITTDVEITSKTHTEYINYHKYLDALDLSTEDSQQVIQSSNRLFLSDTTLDEKKQLLHQLAHIGTSESYDILKRYNEKVDSELKGWSALVLNECQAFLVSNEIDEDAVFVSSGAGGDEKRMRCYFVVSANDNKIFTEQRKDLIAQKFTEVSERLGAKLEGIDFQDYSALLSVLVSLDIAIGDLIEQGLRTCNEDSNFLRVHYYVTNTQKPSEKEIEEYLKEIRNT
jgi:hypothetical protein